LNIVEVVVLADPRAAIVKAVLLGLNQLLYLFLAESHDLGNVTLKAFAFE
jgi:hypothetical protein